MEEGKLNFVCLVGIPKFNRANNSGESIKLYKSLERKIFDGIPYR